MPSNPPPPPPRATPPQIDPRLRRNFCDRCGRPLTKTVERHGYDPHTGEPRLIAHLQCPSRRCRWGF